MLNFIKKDVIVNNVTYVSGRDFNLPKYVEMVKGLLDPLVIKQLGNIPVIIQQSPNPNVAAAISVFQGEYVLMICSNKLDMIFIELKEHERFTFFNSWLIHEAKHLDQIDRGDLVIHEDKPGYITWKGECLKTLEAEGFKYVEQEWEVEAIQAEMQYLVDMGVVGSIEEAYELVNKPTPKGVGF